MLAFDLRNFLLSRGINEPYKWLAKHGFKKDRVKRCLQGTVRKADLDLIETLCYECWALPNDLFVWQPDKHNNGRSRDMPNHPLQEILIGNSRTDINGIIKKLSPESLRKLEKAARQIGEEEIESRKARIEAKRKQKEQ
ncbi:MAG: hypothetical protein KIS94_06845 [Chitinophagales bacterium]|nr:hypothetical protein [Chitinophagales bacterium]